VLVGYLDDVMNDFHKVATVRARGDDGNLLATFDNFMAEAGASSLKAKGAALTLRIMADEAEWAFMTMGGYKFVGFEGNIPDIVTKHELDLRFVDPDNADIVRSIEMKNWANPYDLSPSSSARTQFDQYLNSTISDNTFIYYFGGPVQDAMRSNFADYVKNRVLTEDNFFDQYQTWLNSAGIESAFELEMIVETVTFSDHEHFNFVK